VSIQGTEGSLKLHPLLTPIAMLALARSARQIKRVGRETGVEVVHANSIRAGISSALAARMGGPPAVVHVRDRLPAGAVSRLTLRLLTEGAAAIVSNSRYTADGFDTAGVHADVRVVHNPVDVDRFDPRRISIEEARARLGLASDTPVLGVLAQITPWKAQDDAIRITAKLRRDHPDIRLLIVGSAKFVSKATRFDNPRYLRQLEELTRSLGVTDNVMFLGEREDVPEVLRALDLVLVPSWEEPFGRAIIEAMAVCVPVLATSVGGPPEIISDGEEGLLLPPRQPDIWAQAAHRLLEDPELRAEMGRKGRELAASTFRLERHIDEVLEVYRDLGLAPDGAPAPV
jgi:glycosyltransferase involved in cell wall biosynthesis